MIGHIVSHYRVLQKLGGGGMGVVYQAEDLKLRRTVALKFLAPELTRDEDAKKRFLHEAQAASALDHPNICGIHEIDETPEGQLFIAMTCYEGESLKQRLARRQIDVKEAFEVAYSVAEGLGCAHASGIIHRDIKPANVMITRDGFVKIIDFGLSKLVGRSRVTGSGATLGTVAYMSPEQARSEEVDARADIWALGAVLYEMLTGRLPFRGEIDQAVVYSILNETPPPIREIRPDVPDACAAIVNRCLAKDAAARYQSAEEFSAAVVEAGRKLGWGDSFTTGGVRAVSVVRARDRRQSRVWPFVAVTAVALAAVVVAGLRGRVASPYSTEVRLAVAPLERVGDTPSQALVDGINYAANGAILRARRAHSSMWVLPAWRVELDRPAALDRYRGDFGVNRIVTGSVAPYRQGYRVALSLRDAETVGELRAVSVDIDLARLDRLPALLDGAVARLVGVDSAQIASPVDSHATGANGRVLYETLGVLSRGAARANAAVDLESLTRVVLADTTYLPAVTTLGLVYLRRYEAGGGASDRAAAERWLALAAARDATGVVARRRLAELRMREGRLDEAVALLEGCIRDDPDDMMPYEQLGLMLANAERFDEAREVYQAYARRFPDYHYAHWLLGWFYSLTGEADLRLAESERALALAPDDHRALNTLGLLYSDRGEWSRAREHWERAFLVRPTCANCGNVGYVLYFEGRFADSARYFEYALDYCDSTEYIHWGNLATALYWSEGGRDRSREISRRAIARTRQRLSMVPDDAAAASWLATYHAMVDEREEAFRVAESVGASSEPGVMYRLAQVYEHFGERTRALHYIGEAVRSSYPLYEIMHEPILGDLVKDPRFLQLLDKQTAARGEQESP